MVQTENKNWSQCVMKSVKSQVAKGTEGRKQERRKKKKAERTAS